jgi:ATP-dependent DNA helicase RecG
MLTDEKFWQNLVEEAICNKAEYNFLDFKLIISEKTERFKEHVNAFGNAEIGGCFVFGVNSKFEILGVKGDADKIIQRISHIASNTQEPALSVNAFSMKIEGKVLLCIHVHPGLSKPVFIHGRAPLGGEACFKRSGSSTVVMPVLEIRSRLVSATEIYYDESVLESASLDLLDFGKLKSLLPQLDGTEIKDSKNISILMDYRILRGLKKHPKITVAGWLCFSKNPQKERAFSNAVIEFQIFHGITRENPLKKHEISGTLPEQIEQSIALLLQNIWYIPKIEGIKREDVPAYQETTLREIITNSVVHRDYSKMHQPVKIALFSNRMEIENPGGLMPGLTILNLVHKRDWRNPLLSELMKKFGFGEMDGQGIDRLYAATLAVKVPPPIFIDHRNSFVVVLSAPKSYEDFMPEEKRLMIIIIAVMQGSVDNESIRNSVGISRDKASTLIKSMVNDHVLESSTASRKYAKYRLTQCYQEKIFG